MKNLKIKILFVGVVFTFAFVFGVFAWKRQPVSFCTVIEYRSRYQVIKGDNYVNFKGYLYGGNTLSFVDAEQNTCDEIGAEVVITDESKFSDEIRDLIRELRNKTDVAKVPNTDHEDKFARVEVEIIGTLSEREMYCFTSRYVLAAIEIKPTGSLEVVDSSASKNETKD